MIHLPHITFTVVAGPLDPALMVIVLGTMVIALVANILSLISWLRRR
jgi:hypothetical protein